MKTSWTKTNLGWRFRDCVNLGVRDVRLIMDRNSRRSKGVGNSAGYVYLRFESVEAASRAQQAMHKRCYISIVTPSTSSEQRINSSSAGYMIYSIEVFLWPIRSKGKPTNTLYNTTISLCL
ncbi:unnamed protein product [Fraxinus pennsylvanica]|uniref:RRM domain-containing protein n=1 Tax=Fraxinus pennsylvanica TaxID=56036 RepID=A0AAD2E994_9LAMI|nr:unnamed protein product [Fraxinus pennsylvanica]